jgi:hypothetical protein
MRHDRIKYNRLFPGYFLVKQKIFVSMINKLIFGFIAVFLQHMQRQLTSVYVLSGWLHLELQKVE